MTDATTKKPIRVWSYDKAGAYIMLPVSQLDEVRRLLDSQRIGYRIGEYAISMNGDPADTDIFFDHGADADSIQTILDSVA